MFASHLLKTAADHSLERASKTVFEMLLHQLEKLIAPKDPELCCERLERDGFRGNRFECFTCCRDQCRAKIAVVVYARVFSRGAGEGGLMQGRCHVIPYNFTLTIGKSRHVI